MHRTMILLVSVVLLSLGLDLSHAPLAAAGESRDVVVWAELSSKWPAVGCTVGITVALSTSGASLEGIHVAVALAVDGEVIATDEALTDADGLAVLAVDTTDSYAGADGWIDVNVADRYVSGFSLYPVDAARCESESDTFMKTVPLLADDASEASAASRAGAVFIKNVPTSYVQQRNLSCEYASLYIATATFGQGISEYAFDDVVGWSENPHWGYRGDINGWWGNTDDYGVYAEALVPALAAFGFHGEAFYGDGDPAALTSRIDRGMPTLVWLALRGDTSFYAYTEDGTRYKLAAYEHVVVAYGYDAGGVYVADPAIGAPRYYTWEEFMPMWNVLDGMALAVAPA